MRNKKITQESAQEAVVEEVNNLVPEVQSGERKFEEQSQVRNLDQKSSNSKKTSKSSDGLLKNWQQ